MSILLSPVVKAVPTSIPTATFELPSVIAYSANEPIPVLYASFPLPPLPAKLPIYVFSVPVPVLRPACFPNLVPEYPSTKSILLPLMNKEPVN